MIENFSAKDLVGFKEIDLEFTKGLNVFSGASGAGKSVLIDGILSTLGISDAKATFAETQTKELILRSVKKEKARYFLNDEPISKKQLSEQVSSKILYLSANDSYAFSRASLLSMLNTKSKAEFDALYKEFLSAKENLKQLQENFNLVEEKKEFLTYEIKKINEINPKHSEEEELTEKKKNFSDREKIKNLLTKVSSLPNAKSNINSLFNLLNIDNSVCEDFFATLDDALLSANEIMSDEQDIDKIMQRLDELSYLVKKYGGVNEAIIAKEEKEKELSKLDNIANLVDEASLNLKNITKKLKECAKTLSDERKIASQKLQEDTNKMLEILKLGSCKIYLDECEIDSLGTDNCTISLSETASNKISAGEARRLRLALFASATNSDVEVLILDEADANLSGTESQAVAKLLKLVSKKYQLFAITHQAHTAAIADSHFLVCKNEFGSQVSKLNKTERISEIARILSGEGQEKESIELAKKLLAN